MTDTTTTRRPVLGMPRVACATLLAVVALASPALAQTITRGPIIQNPDALLTTMTILWWTNVAGDSTVEYGTTPALGSSVTVAQAASCEIGAAGTCHAVPITGLQPGTRYFYRLLTNGVEVQAASASIYFTTLMDPSDPADLFFTVVGDWGQASSAETDVANLQDADDPPMIVTVGDNAYTNGTQSDWDNNALAYYVNPMRRALFMPILGNHDVNSSGPANWFNSVEIKMFQLPRNAPPGQEERYFSFDDGDAHFIALDANSPGDPTQRAWLANDLATTTRRWKFVFLHQTPYSCANGVASIGSNATVRTNWGPLFEYYGVDIVFDGHDHIYERSIPLDDFADADGTPGTDGRTTLYVMTGGGGSTLDDAAMVDGSGPFRKPFFFSTRENCYWLQSGCPGGVSSGSGPSYCSFKRFSYNTVRIVERHHAHRAGDRPERRRLRLLLDHEERSDHHHGAAHDDDVDDHEQHDQHHDVDDHHQHDHLDDDHLDHHHDVDHVDHGATAAADHLVVDDHPVHVVHHLDDHLQHQHARPPPPRPRRRRPPPRRARRRPRRRPPPPRPRPRPPRAPPPRPRRRSRPRRPARRPPRPRRRVPMPTATASAMPSTTARRRRTRVRTTPTTTAGVTRATRAPAARSSRSRS